MRIVRAVSTELESSKKSDNKQFPVLFFEVAVQQPHGHQSRQNHDGSLHFWKGILCWMSEEITGIDA